MRTVVLILSVFLYIFVADAHIFTFNALEEDVDFIEFELGAKTNEKVDEDYYKYKVEPERKGTFTPWPVIFVPGDGGSQVEAKLNKTSQVHYLCTQHTTDFFSLWLNLELLMPTVIDCWVDNMKLSYNKTTRSTTNTPGVDIRIPQFGDPFPVEWLDPSKASAGAYFKDISNMLVTLGLERNKSIRGAPYDFRKAPNENEDFFSDFQTLVEETYKQNGNRRVILIAHSMGSPMMRLFLNNQLQSWKDQYIRSLITLGGVWGGTVKAMKVYTEGDSLGSRFLSARTMRSEQITSPSLAWLMPDEHFWNDDEVIIETVEKNYTVKDYQQFFTDIDYLDGWYMREDVEYISHQFYPPGVELHCLYGVGMETVEKLKYAKDTFPNGNAALIYGDGDGTVNRRSLEGCLRWRTMQSQPIYSQAFPKTEHLAILGSAPVIDYIKQVVSSP